MGYTHIKIIGIAATTLGNKLKAKTKFKIIHTDYIDDIDDIDDKNSLSFI